MAGPTADDAPSNAFADVPLPPEGAINEFFELHVTPFDDSSADDPNAAAISEVHVALWSDGTFEIRGLSAGVFT